METFVLNIARKFDAGVISVEHITTCRNIIYKAICKEYVFVIRLTDRNVRSREEIECELKFQQYLFENGANVTKPLATINGQLIIGYENSIKSYYASAFTFAEGLDWDERCDETPETLYRIGKALGRIHKLSKSYNSLAVKRRKWYEQQELVAARELFSTYNKDLYTSFREFIDSTKNWSCDKDRFGLTHGDYLMSNYLIDKELITVIDFDECEFSWFAMDIAICMRCYLIGDKPESVSKTGERAEAMHYNLLSGYATENLISDDMVYNLNNYIRIRDYIEISQLLGIINQGGTLCDIEKRLLVTDVDRVLHNRPLVEYNLTGIAKAFL